MYRKFKGVVGYQNTKRCLQAYFLHSTFRGNHLNIPHYRFVMPQVKIDKNVSHTHDIRAGSSIIFVIVFLNVLKIINNL